MSNNFWFEAISKPDKTIWRFRIGIDEDTLVALVSGKNDYEACARARLITKALNDEARTAAIAANHDGDDQ